MLQIMTVCVMFFPQFVEFTLVRYIYIFLNLEIRKNDKDLPEYYVLFNV
jgi:hypothetical protein